MANLPRHSCLKCRTYLTCMDKRKNEKGHKCDKFKVTKLGHVADFGELELELEPVVSPSKAIILPSNTGPKYTKQVSVSDTDELADDFVWQAMTKAYDPETNTVRDLRIDDSDARAADNYYDFCANLVGKNIKMPFARQLWVAIVALAEHCPRCTNPIWSSCIENVPVDMDPHDLAKKLVLLKRGTCPKCGSKRGALILSGELNDYYEIVLVLGQRAGKSIFTATLVCYLVQCYLKLPRLSTIAKGIQDFTPLTGTFVAITATKAVKLLWDPIRNMVANSEWFQTYFSILDHHGKMYGKEFYQFSPTGTYMRFFHKNLDFYPEGPGKRTLRGPTRVISAIDELGHFPYKIIESNSDEDDIGEDDERERANADEVHTVLSRSLATVRSELPGFYKQGIHHVPQGFLANISSPASWKDKIMRLLKESESSPSMLGLRYPTWEINPLYSRDHPVIRDAYKRNPRTADRDFGANPPKLASTIFDKEQIVKLFSGENSHAIVYEESAEKTLAKVITKIEPRNLPPAVLTLDAGATNNSYSGTLQYKDGATVKTISLIEIIPQKGKRIDFFYVYQNVLKPIIKEFNVKIVVYDRWNSYQVIDQIQHDFKGAVKSAQYTLKSRDFTGFQDIVNNEHLVLPKLELEPDRIEAVIDYRKELLRYPASHLYLQFLTVQEFGGVWTKGDGYTDDILRALILGVTTLFQPKVVEYMSKFKTTERAGVSPKATVLVAGRTNIFNNFNP